MASSTKINSTSRIRRLSAWWPCLLVVLPVLIIALLMKSFVLNAPFMDDYVWVPTYEKIVAGKMTLRDCFIVQMEHRITIPALIIWALHHLAHADFTAQNWVSFGEMVLTLGNIAFLLRKTISGRFWGWLLLILAAWTVFNPVQCYTILWSICMISFQPALFLSSALAAFQSRLRPMPKFILCLLAAVCGTHCFASGIQIWILLLPLIFWSAAIPNGVVRRNFAIAWLAAFGITMAFYFHNLVNEVDPGFAYLQGKEETADNHLGAFFESPLRSLRFVLMFMGSLLGRGTFAAIMNSSLLAGVLLLAVMLVGIGAAWKWRKDRAFLSSLLPWICFGTYSIGTGTMVGLGRLWADEMLWGALWNRYTTHAVPLTVSGLVIAVLVFRRWQPAGIRWQRFSPGAGAAAIAAFATIIGVGWIYGADQMNAWHSSRLRDATCQLFAQLPANEALATPMMNTNSYAARLENLRMMRPPLLKDFQLDHFKKMPTPLHENLARLETCEPIAKTEFRATGFAMLPGGLRVADGVFLTWKDDAGKETIFGLGHSEEQPFYLSDVLYCDTQYVHQPHGNFRHAYGYYEIRFDAASLPAGAHDITAWVFDFTRQAVMQMPGKFTVNTSTHEVLEIPTAVPTEHR